MTLNKRPLGWIAVGALWAVASGLPAAADDTEIFVGTSGVGVQPNILFIIDDSTSMGGQVWTQAEYDPAMTYPTLAGCVADRIYWRTGTGPVPTCTGSPDRWLNMSAMKCDAAIQGFNSAGFYSATMAAQYDPAENGGRWEALNTNTSTSTTHAAHARVVECYDDHGVHGPNATDTVNTYARNGQPQGGNGTGYWGTVATEVSWGASPITNLSHYFYKGNYLNYLLSPQVQRTRLAIVQDVATDVLDTVNGVNVGFLDFNLFNGDNTNGSQGGHVTHAMESIATARTPMKNKINALVAGGSNPLTSTPLAETLYESALYYKGDPVAYGNVTPTPAGSVPESRIVGSVPSRYESPIDALCQKNFVVLLSDGEPTWDVNADTNIRGMRDAATGTFASLVGGSCDVEAWQGIDFPDPPNGELSNCVDDLAEFMFDGDFSTLPGQQNITTYTVGFTVNLPLLAQTAQRGGGEYYTANDAGELTGALTNIVTSILSYDTTFTSPTVAVNAFNRTENLSDLFVNVFRPSALTHWPGNLKKYRLNDNGVIVDANNQPAVDPSTGYFSATAQSYWSPSLDGSNVELGGAANAIPAPASRIVYSNISTNTNPLVRNDLTHADNRVRQSNPLITDGLLGTNSEPPTRNQVIDFVNGWDTSDTDQDNVVNEPRRQLGDPLHSQPASVIYGPGLRDGLIFFGTNDGFLHAIDIQTGAERWAFIPRPEFLDNQVQLWEDDPASSKHFGIDGNIRVYMKADGDNVIEAGEKVYLFFGLRRGGGSYYGLDVTNPLSPQLMWRLDSANLPGIGQSWSTPVPTKIQVGNGSTQNADKTVLVIGGGYEPDQDNDAASTDTIGNSIYIVDMVSGALLWQGSRTIGNKTFNNGFVSVSDTGKSMAYSFPGDIRVIDMNNNGFADRMYAADMGGQVWRFDITNGDPAATLVAGGVIAQLGAAPLGTAAPLAQVRRFYNAPDIAFVNNRTEHFTHIGIGSGHREHPLGTANQDRFYALRDYGLTKKTQAQFDAIVPTTDAALVPIVGVGTNVPVNSKGWRLDLSLAGEKVLAEARTIANTVHFSTYRPGSSASSCTPQAGTNRHYQMSLLNGNPVTNLDGVVGPALTMSDVSADGIGGAISTPTQVLFLSEDTDGDGIPDNVETDDDNDGIQDVDDVDSDNDGIPDSLDPDDDNDGTPDSDEDAAWECTDFACVRADFDNNPVRTYWSQRSLD